MSSYENIVFAASPNWYCSCILDLSSSNLLVYAARRDILIWDAKKYPPIYIGVFYSHKEKVSALKLLTLVDKTTLCLSGSDDGHVKIWDIVSKSITAEHDSHIGKVTAVCWRDVHDITAISGDDKGMLVIWQHLDNRTNSFMPEKSPVTALAASTLSKYFAVGYRNGIVLLLGFDGGLVHRLRGHDEDVQCLAWSPVPGEEIKKDKKYYDRDDPFAPDYSEEAELSTSEGKLFGEIGHLLASGSKDKTIRIWSSLKGRELSQMKLPRMTNRDSGAGEFTRVWTSFLWLDSNPECIVSSSLSGELLLWNIREKGSSKCTKFFEKTHKINHQKMVFNLCAGFDEGKSLMYSMAIDRQIICWDLDKRQPLGAIPSNGGFVYIIKTSLVDPGRLAYGVGDGMVKVWNTNNKNYVTDVRTMWQGIKGKVTALSWHPVKENILAYGTDDGRVGFFDVMTMKSPSISLTYHKRTVYVVTWGPSSSAMIGEEDMLDAAASYSLYSVGDGVILEHNVKDLHDEAKSINNLIQLTNGQTMKISSRSEISWSPDMAFVAIGNDDGSVEIYQPPRFHHIITVHIHKKLVNAVVWHPQYTAEFAHGSPLNYWVATASNEAVVNIVDLSSVLSDDNIKRNEGGEKMILTEAKKQLLGHVDRVTGLAWSPHSDNELVSVSYDGQAIVWNVNTRELTACYNKQKGKLLSAQWDGVQPDLVYTGGDDFSIHRWKPSQHPFDPETCGRQKRNKLKFKKEKKKAQNQSKADTKVEKIVEDITLSKTDQEDLKKVLEEKAKTLQPLNSYSSLEPCKKGFDRNLVKNSSADSGDGYRELSCHGDSNLSNVHLEADRGGATITGDISADGKSAKASVDKSDSAVKDSAVKDKKKKAWKPKSYFPLVGRAENRGKDFLHEDLIYLVRKVYNVEEKVNKAANVCPPKVDHSDQDDSEGEVEYDKEFLHLGFFLDRRAMYQCLAEEGLYHRDHDNMDYFYQMEIWKGNINGALRMAREREELSDWLVSMAPMAAYDTWVTVCEDYAHQLESEGQYHKAATYLLAANKVHNAIELFRKHRLFKEAIALAKVRLSPFDPVLEDLYTLWAQQLTLDGNYEQAAKCHIAMKQVQDAALLLARRYNQSSLKTASHICLLASEKQQGLLYGYKVISQYMLSAEWMEAYNFLKDQKSLQCLTLVAAMHELTIKELQSTNHDILKVESEKFTNWCKVLHPQANTIIPDFILDSDENDPISPWRPKLIEGHAFIHFVLRVLYSHLGVCMDTTNLEDMYKSLSILHAGRQVQTDIRQLLVQVCLDLVLCILSLLMSETPTAISHLLQGVSLLHEAGEMAIMEHLLRMFLPQGPKYMLKLQQEVTAMRVVISMDSESTIEGASKMHTIKRYLSELKDEEAVSNSSLRCRELDCLRAYYYLAILHFLKCFLEKQQNQDNDLPVTTESSTNHDGDNTNKPVITDSKTVTEESLSDNKSGESTQSLVQNNSKETEPSSGSEDGEKVCEDGEIKKHSLDLPTIVVEETESNCTLPSNVEASAAKIDNPSSNGQSHIGLSQKVLNMNHYLVETVHSLPQTYQLTKQVISHLARGLLWDLQGKRYALTETLGHIHKAISQLLLAQKPSSSLSSVQNETLGSDRSSPLDNSFPQGLGMESGMSISLDLTPKKAASASSSPQRSPLPSPSMVHGTRSPDTNSPKKRHSSDPVAPFSGLHTSMGCPFHRPVSHALSRSVSTDSGAIDMGPIQEYLSISDLDPEGHHEGAHGTCSSCEWLSKSRKVLWEDDHCRSQGQLTSRNNMTSFVNPAKYINVPDEWYNMPADQKYFMPYITMAILKDEQEYMMHELKRGPDALQMPFPNPIESVKYLLDISGKSSFLTLGEKQQLAERIVTWGMKYSVSSQQKDVLSELLQSSLIQE